MFKKSLFLKKIQIIDKLYTDQLILSLEKSLMKIS
jgi:hypothetical protein